MRHLFDLDKKDYAQCTKKFVRDSARSVIISDGRIAMVHGLKYDYYKFPGGGIRAGEDPVDAMIRETEEEAGLIVIPGSVREYGLVHRIQKSHKDDAEYFVQDNYYYLCAARPGRVSQKLDDYEAEEHFTLEYVEPEKAIRTNREGAHGPKDPIMLEREARVLEMLLAEGYFGNKQV
ncbi:MAG: NUDIX domain-containing protein [Lachnospiraceae bacterium]|nr:NUDIX domain-containing protein [Lachnospiraceae bacterium]